MKTLVLYTKPVPVNQKYGVFHNRMILTSKYRDTKESMKWEITSLWGHFAPITGVVALNIRLYYGDKRKRDCDAYIKILLDALSGIVYKDDSQIDELHVWKLYDKEKPRIEIDVCNKEDDGTACLCTPQ